MTGFSSVLAPSCFVYHAGSGITRAEGMIGDGDHIVHAHQSIIDQRYPRYHSELVAFTASKVTDGLKERGLRAIVRAAARDRGYRIEVSRLSHRTGDEGRVRFVIEPDATAPVISGWYEGFRAEFAVGARRGHPHRDLDRRSATRGDQDLQPGTGLRSPAPRAGRRAGQAPSANLPIVNPSSEAESPGPAPRSPLEVVQSSLSAAGSSKFGRSALARSA